MKATRTWAHLALFLVAIFYGGNYIVAKVVMNGDHMDPLALALLRVVSAATLFWLLFPFTRGERIRREDLKYFAVCGLLGVATNQSLFLSGLELTTPVHASLIMTTCPVLVLVFSHVILKEQITSRKILGIMLGCTGAVLLMTTGHEVSTNRTLFVGDLMVFGNATAFALYMVIAKRLVSRYSTLTVIRWVFTFGLLFLFPLAIRDFSQVQWSAFTPNIWLAILYIIICVTFLAYLLNMFGLKYVNPSTASTYIYLQPLCAAILSALLAMEEFNLSKVFSGVLIFLGVYLVSDLQVERRITRADKTK